jgi:aryl-alcohol dehydrogenase-like predicted oxidoreductase
MAKLVQAGKVRYLGVSNFSVAQLERVHKIHPIVSLQPPFSLLRRDIEAGTLPFCARQRIGVVVYSPLQKGLLTGAFSVARRDSLPPEDHRRNDPWFAEPEFSATLRFVEGLAQLAKAHGMSVAELALAWVLRRAEVTAAIVGARRLAQIEETTGAAETDLSPAMLRAIEGLLEQRSRTHAPAH